MADQIKLKAFVRIDGTGKVIPGGPIFQAQKPKVGKWREISIKECCNYNPNTTTTTTSSTSSTSTSTTTTTTTQASRSEAAVTSFSGGQACLGNGNNITLYYTGSLGLGTALYTDSGLTVPYLGQSGNYVRLYFAAQYNVCYVTGVNGDNTISSVSAC